MDVDPECYLPSDNARSVFAQRWSLRGNGDGVPTETFAEAADRVAGCVASGAQAASASQFVINITETADANPLAFMDQIVRTAGTNKETLKAAFKSLLTSLRFFPNSPAWTGASTPLGQLAACFVLPIEDSLESIMNTMHDAVMIQRTGGGNGFSFSRLRPAGARVHSSGGTSTGPIAFLRAYDRVFGSIAQGGTRRGANMAVLRVDHPDIEEFIACKDTEGDIANFNISVAITDKFMQSCEDETKSGGATHDLIDPSTGEVVKTVDPHALMRKIAEQAHRNGEPGVLFIDEANRTNPVPKEYTLESTNPCGSSFLFFFYFLNLQRKLTYFFFTGEQWLGPYENCCLGSVNLAKHVTEDGEFDFEMLHETVVLSTMFLDCMVSANKYVDSVPQLKEAAMKCRRIGLGIMGLHDALMLLDLPYDSAAGRAFAQKIMHAVRYTTLATSMVLAHYWGPFPAYDSARFSRLLWDSEKYEDLREFLTRTGLRNAAQNTIAPTGTLSTVAGCEGYGCEPLFALAHRRYVVDPSAADGSGRRSMDYVSEIFRSHIESAFDKGVAQSILDRVAETGSCQNIDELSQHTKDVFRTAGEISVNDHIGMQSVLQEEVDNSISKTINMPESSTVESVEWAYRRAWVNKCKGLTVYRTNSRNIVVLETKKPEPEPADTRIKRPGQLTGKTLTTDTPIGTAFATINEIAPGVPFEVFLTASKAGSETAAMTEAIGRLCSYVLRIDCGVPAQARLEVIVRQLENIGGGRSVGRGPTKVRSLPDGLARMLQRYLLGPEDAEEPKQEQEQEQEQTNTNTAKGDLCPDCGNPTYIRSEGCTKCTVCGRSEC